MKTQRKREPGAPRPGARKRGTPAAAAGKAVAGPAAAETRGPAVARAPRPQKLADDPSRGTRLALWEWDIATGRLVWSGVVDALLGRESGTFPGTIEAWEEIIHPSERARVRRHLAAHLETDAPYDIEYRVRRADGTYGWWHDIGACRRDADGKPVYMAGACVDITERRRAEEALEHSVSLLRATVESTADGLLAVDEAGKITGFNQRFAQLWRMPAEILASRDDEQALRFVLDQLTDPEAFLAKVRELYGHPDAESFDTLAFKDGRVFERYSRPQFLDGRPIGRVWSFRDVTERRRAEERIEEQAALLDVAQDGIAVFDLDGRVRYWNQGCERLTGWSAAEVRNRLLDPEVYRDCREATAAARRQVLDTGYWSGDLTLWVKGSRRIVVRSSRTLVLDAAGRPKAVLEVNSDITEQKRLEAQLLHAQRIESVGRLANGVAHDLNNVLTPILMSVDLLRRKLQEPAELRLVDMLHEGAQRAADIVRQLLTYSRGAEGQRSELNLADVIRETSRMIQQTFPKSIVVETSIAPDLRAVLGDATQLQQVLLNLCVNARDAMPQGGALTIEAASVALEPAAAGEITDAKPGLYVVLRVSDTGTGIAADIIDKIFDPFFTTKSSGQGSGLGLCTVEGIVRSHGGFVQVQSQVGHGARFSVFLPARESAAPRREERRGPAAPAGQGGTILLVDDEPAVRQTVASVLEGEGYTVLMARNGAEALALASAHKPQVRAAIVDMWMPGMDGAVLLRELPTLVPGIRIIAISGLPALQAEAAAASAAVKAFLPKPCTPQELLETLSRVLV